jgi:DNA-binding transcriptional ArsR family regulator
MFDVEAAIRAIAERHRREIVRLVRDEELTAGQIAAHFEVSRPAVSQHLRILKDTGLVSERRQGTRRYYRARVEGLAELRAFLEVLLGEETWVEPGPGGGAKPAVSADVDVRDEVTRT